MVILLEILVIKCPLVLLELREHFRLDSGKNVVNPLDILEDKGPLEITRTMPTLGTMFKKPLRGACHWLEILATKTRVLWVGFLDLIVGEENILCTFDYTRHVITGTKMLFRKVTSGVSGDIIG